MNDINAQKEVRVALRTKSLDLAQTKGLDEIICVCVVQGDACALYPLEARGILCCSVDGGDDARPGKLVHAMVPPVFRIVVTDGGRGSEAALTGKERCYELATEREKAMQSSNKNTTYPPTTTSGYVSLMNVVNVPP